MFKRFLSLFVFLSILSAVVGGTAGRNSMEAAGNISASTGADDDSDGPWDRAAKSKRRISSIPEAGRGGEVRLQRDADSHFYANANIDGTTIRVMVDSGASMVALTRRDAEAIGIDVDSLPIGGMANTAGGEVPIRSVMLDDVDIDGVSVRGVAAAVIDADMPASLLGQSYLSRLATVKVENDEMSLR